jgi:endonuclease III
MPRHAQPPRTPPGRSASRPRTRDLDCGDYGAAARPLVTDGQAREIFDRLDAQHPNADTELVFRNAYELLVATILSAQCTDARVNQVTPSLFERYPDPQALAQAGPAALEPLIASTGFFRMKARALSGMAQALVSHHGGRVPASIDALVALPGVGRKTANVVLGHALGVPGFPVDRHVLRVANRLGLVKSDSPDIVERVLCRLLPPERWTRSSDALILHGRRVCRPTPLCDRCHVRTECAHFRGLGPKTRRPRAARAQVAS